MAIDLHGRRRVLGGLLAAPFISAIPHAGRGTPTPQISLKSAASRSGRYFGAAVRIDQLRGEPRLEAVVLRDCAWLTPEIHMKWDALQPAPGAFNFGPADGLLRFAIDNGQTLRGHTLLWDQSTPAWAKAAMRRNDGWRTVSDHFAHVLGRYGAEVPVWDVVNEPIDVHRADGLRSNSFLKAFGPGYVSRALHEARALAPRARLAINDYGFDYDNPEEAQRRRNFLRLVSDLRREGAPLDEVGIQAHLDLSKGPINPAILKAFLDDLAALGVDIVVTELDVKEADRRAPLEERDRRVAAEASAFLETALQQPAVKGVITWGLSDRHSWLQGEGDGRVIHRSLPYDDNLAPKPMYFALEKSLAARTRAGSDHHSAGG